MDILGPLLIQTMYLKTHKNKQLTKKHEMMENHEHWLDIILEITTDEAVV